VGLENNQMNHSDEILKSWKANAANWISTIDENEIESRTLVTNSAIVDTILNYRPSSILDIGCGEGWLTRTLNAKGIPSHGIDAVESLINNAISKGGDNYSICSYEDLINNKWNSINETENVVMNFSLLDKDNTANLLAYLSKTLKNTGLIFIQTLHPFYGFSDNYESGWKDGSWNGLKRDFTHSYKWYFRTLEDWISLFSKSGLLLRELKEPIHPTTKKPASIIFVLYPSR
jgi:2-polyprenyl-3-methyl-5-hydroxy-6-metoxy-1,4-benzoquinol methylase